MTNEKNIFGTELKKISDRGALGGTGEGQKKSPPDNNIQPLPILSSGSKNCSEPLPILSSDTSSTETPPATLPLESQKFLAPYEQNTNLTAKDIADLQTLDQVIPNWRNRILELAAEGKSQVEIRVALCRDSENKFSANLWSTLKAREPVVQDYFEQAKEIAEAYWAQMGRDLLVHEKGTTVEASIWIFSMKNRFGWRDTKPGDLVPQAMLAMGNVMQQVRARMASAQEENAAQGITHVARPKSKGGRKTNAERKQRSKTQNSGT